MAETWTGQKSYPSLRSFASDKRPLCKVVAAILLNFFQTSGTPPKIPVNRGVQAGQLAEEDTHERDGQNERDSQTIPSEAEGNPRGGPSVHSGEQKGVETTAEEARRRSGYDEED